MIIFLYLSVVAACEAARITRGIEHPLFPNFRAVYHGHGATSYQNVQIESGKHIAVPSNYELEHSAIPTHQIIYPTYVDLLDHVNYENLNARPIAESDTHVDYVSETAAPLDEVFADHEKLKDDLILPQYEHYEHSQDYEYH